MTTNIASLNMPSWSEAPEWAYYLALEPDGTWLWFNKRPSIAPTGSWMWIDGGRVKEHEETSYRAPIPDWFNHLYSHPNLVDDLPSSPREAVLDGFYGEHSTSSQLDGIEGILSEVYNKLDERGQERDEENGERSIPNANKAWWHIYGDRILKRGYPLDSELWAFMLVLKLVRNTRDDMLDGVAYMALALESFDQENANE